MPSSVVFTMAARRACSRPAPERAACVGCSGIKRAQQQGQQNAQCPHGVGRHQAQPRTKLGVATTWASHWRLKMSITTRVVGWPVSRGISPGDWKKVPPS